MRLSQKTDYALRILMHLALDDEIAAVPRIASCFGLSEHHVMKVAQCLSRAGWVKTHRGRGGGLTLDVDPHALRVGEVVRQVEPDFRLVECFASETNGCVITQACRLQGALERALQLFLDHLDTVTLADLTVEPKQLTDLLQIQSATGS